MRSRITVTFVLAGMLAALGMYFLKELSARQYRSGDGRDATAVFAGGAAPKLTTPAGTVSEAQSALLAANLAAPPNPGGQVTAVGQTIPQPDRAGEDASDLSRGDGDSEKSADIRSRLLRLEELATANDRQSLDQILSELTNADPRIRQAAREATVQFGSREAASGLTEAAAMVEDPHEKVALLDAAAYLDLPSLSEPPAQPRETAAGGGFIPRSRARQPHLPQAPAAANPTL